jgi:hypothetical protein
MMRISLRAGRARIRHAALGERHERGESASTWAQTLLTPDYMHPGALAAGFRTAVLTAVAICAAGGLLAALTITNPRPGATGNGLAVRHPRCGRAAQRHWLKRARVGP